MASRCSQCGKGTQTGNSVSHSVRRVKRTFKRNLLYKRTLDPKTGCFHRMRICSTCFRTNRKRMLASVS